MRLAIAQINAIVGDLTGNSTKILNAASEAIAMGATIMVTPELALSGYPPEDLLLRNDFNQACEQALSLLAQRALNITMVIGHPIKSKGACYNAASVIQDGKIIGTYHKHVLPNHTVFDEVRYFAAGHIPLVFEHQGLKIGVLICADIWESAPAKSAQEAGADILLALNASPYHIDKISTRQQVATDRVQETGLPIVYANLVGGQDELVFDGASFVLNADGVLTQRLHAFKTAIACVDFIGNQPQSAEVANDLSIEAAVYGALRLGLSDYVDKNGFPSVVLGLSGGVDSALTLAIAVDALGSNRVQAVMMPTEYTSAMSLEDAQEMASLLGVKYTNMPISDLFANFRTALSEQFVGLPFDATEENLQARIRGTLLMALSNKFGSIVVTTGNKSEMAVGYSTLYGDMAGGFSLLKDVPKTLVYQLVQYRNKLSRVIPERIITRPPSAELKPGQTDQDNLPAYEILDAIMQAYVEEDKNPTEIVAMGYSTQDVTRVTRLIDRNEYKRRQAPVGVRITQRGFGKDRRYPITCKFEFTQKSLNT